MIKYTENIISKIRNAEVLLLGCSAGGFNVIFELIISLPEDFPIPVVVVIHRGKKYKSSIESLMNSKAKVVVKLAEDKEEMKKGFVYFAPSDYHLLLEPEGLFTLDYSEPVLFCRPSIDITFQSIADVWEEKVISILLSGANADGANGVYAVKEKNGIVVVQDPNEAEVRTMPEAAIGRTKTDFILGNKEIFEFVDSLSAIRNNITSAV